MDVTTFMPTVAVLRFRASSRTADGLPPDRLMELFSVKTVTHIDGDCLEYEPSVEEQFLTKARQLSREHDLLVIDHDFDYSAVRPALCKQYLNSVVEELARVDVAVILIGRSLPVKSDDLWRTITESSNIVALSAGGNAFHAESWSPPVGNRLIDGLKTKYPAHRSKRDPVVPPIWNLFLRRRGVFKYPDGKYYEYFYEIDSEPTCEITKSAGGVEDFLSESLLGHVEDHVENNGTGRDIVLVFNRAGGSKSFGRVLDRLQAETREMRNVTYLDADDWQRTPEGLLEPKITVGLTEERFSQLSAARKLYSGKSHVLFITPILYSSAPVEDLVEMFGQPGCSFSCFTLLLSSTVRTGSKNNRRPRLKLRNGSRVLIDIDYMYEVDLGRLKKDSKGTGRIRLENWKVRASDILRQTRSIDENSLLGFRNDETASKSYISPIALWSLYKDCGVDKENGYIPEGAGDRPFLYYPQLNRLERPNPDGLADKSDSHWIAESIIQASLKKFRCSRSQLMVVAPAEIDPNSNSTRLIADAMRERGVEVRMLRRNDIEQFHVPKELRFAFKGNSLKVVVFDEMTSSGGTFRKLAGAVSKAIADHEGGPRDCRWLFATVLCLGKEQDVLERLVQTGSQKPRRDSEAAARVAGSLREASFVALDTWTPLGHRTRLTASNRMAEGGGS